MNDNYFIKKSPLLIIPFLFVGLFLLSRLLQTSSELSSIVFETDRQEEVNGRVRYVGNFQIELKQGESLFLYAENAKICLTVKDTVYEYNTMEKTPSNLKSPGASWYRFDSPGVLPSEKVEFTVESYYGENENAAHQLFSRLYVGDGSGLYQMMFGGMGFLGLIHICALIAGIIYIVEGTINLSVGVRVEGMSILLFGCYFFSGGLWCMTDILYPYLSLLIAPTWVASLLDISGVILFPIALALLISYYMQSRNNKRVMKAIVIAEILTAAICVFYQCIGIADIMELQIFIGIVSFLSLGVAVIAVGAELLAYKNNHLLYLFLAVLPVFISEMVDAVNVLMPFMPRRTLMTYSFAVSILLLTFQLASFANMLRRREQKMNQMEKELADSKIAVMLSQIHPHFLYNSLVGIKQLCNINPKKASDALEHFAYYLRANLYSVTETNLIPFQREVLHVKDYLYLEEMRFEERVQIFWELSFMEFFLPPLTLQPIVENAVRHGITKREKGGKITIKSDASPDEIYITVEDDGIGFGASEMKDSSRPHIGIENVRKRLEGQCGGKLNLYSIPGEGTKVTLILPRRENQVEYTCNR